MSKAHLDPVLRRSWTAQRRAGCIRFGDRAGYAERGGWQWPSGAWCAPGTTGVRLGRGDGRVVLIDPESGDRRELTHPSGAEHGERATHRLPAAVPALPWAYDTHA